MPRNQRTKLSSRVHTLLAHNLIVFSGWSAVAGNSTSIPSHQHFLCKLNTNSIMSKTEMNNAECAE